MEKAQPAPLSHGSYLNFKERLPSLAQILPVYAVIMVMVYTWTLLWFFWKVPSWLFFMNAGDILSVVPYLFATNLAESLLVLCGPLFLSLVLPKTWFHDVFVARGAALSASTLGYMMYLANQFKNKSDYPTLSLQLWSVLLALVGIAVLGYLFGQFRILRRIIELISDRLTIFVYIFGPLSILSVLVLIVRALLG